IEPQALAQQRADRLDRLIASRVSKGVVDRFQSIDVGKEHADGAAAAVRKQRDEVIVKWTPPREAGFVERVRALTVRPRAFDERQRPIELDAEREKVAPKGLPDIWCKRSRPFLDKGFEAQREIG